MHIGYKVSNIIQAIIEFQTGIPQHTPLEWPFNQETNKEQETNIRLSMRRFAFISVSLIFLQVISEAFETLLL